jgi:hypothetical protein
MVMPATTLDSPAGMFRRRIVNNQSNTDRTIKEMTVCLEQF